MLPTNTLTAGWLRTRTPQGGRTSHLLPEIHARSKRILQQAAQEGIAANSSVVQQFVEVWKAKVTGASCTCTKKMGETVIEESKDGYLDLKEFILTNKIRPAKITESCPICYGTGLIGGYDLQGANTLVLDASLNPQLNEVSLQRERPWWFKASSNCSITWLVTIPKYISDVYGVMIKWKQEPQSWNIVIEDEPLTRDAILNYTGKRAAVTLTMKDKTNNNAGVYAIFLILSIGSVLVNVDAPLWTKSYGGSFRIWGEVPETITAHFDSRIQNLTTQDIFVFEDGGIAYRIVQVEENKPLGIPITWNTEANLIRPSAYYYHIPSKLMLTNYAIKDVSFII